MPNKLWTLINFVHPFVHSTVTCVYFSRHAEGRQSIKQYLLNTYDLFGKQLFGTFYMFDIVLIIVVNTEK